jgi:hypothetical protein
MKGIDGSFVPIGFSRTKTEKLKNWSEKCEGSSGGIDKLKNQSGKCEGPAGEIDGLKNQSEKCEGLKRRGDQRLFEKKSFFKKPKTSTKHC